MKVLLQNVLLILAAMLLALLAACKDNPTGSNDFTVTVSVANLPRLAEGQGYYRLWISFPEKTQLAKPGHGDEDYVSFGAFNVSTDGKKLECLCGNPKVFEPAQEVDINLAADALITIETEGDLSEEPGARLVGGVFTGNDRTATAQLEAQSEDVFDFDYATATAVFTLNTPTTAETADFRNGIWWMQPAGNAIAGIQDFPALADTARWRYEGWIIDKSTSSVKAYSTGRFRDVNGPDEDFAGVTAGTNGSDSNADGRGDGFAFPGQDFVRAANGLPGPLQLDNGNFEARLTLEPEPDNSPSPFYLTVLSTPVIGPNLNNATQVVTMENRARSAFPAATVTIQR